jgi:hypothetical protein
MCRYSIEGDEDGEMWNGDLRGMVGRVEVGTEDFFGMEGRRFPNSIGLWPSQRRGFQLRPGSCVEVRGYFDGGVLRRRGRSDRGKAGRKYGDARYA